MLPLAIVNECGGKGKWFMMSTLTLAPALAFALVMIFRRSEVLTFNRIRAFTLGMTYAICWFNLA